MLVNVNDMYRGTGYLQKVTGKTAKQLGVSCAFKRGLSDDDVRLLGRWRSISTAQHYRSIDPAKLYAISKIMAETLKNDFSPEIELPESKNCQVVSSTIPGILTHTQPIPVSLPLMCNLSTPQVAPASVLSVGAAVTPVLSESILPVSPLVKTISSLPKKSLQELRAGGVYMKRGSIYPPKRNSSNSKLCSPSRDSISPLRPITKISSLPSSPRMEISRFEELPLHLAGIYPLGMEVPSTSAGGEELLNLEGISSFTMYMD